MFGKKVTYTKKKESPQSMLKDGEIPKLTWSTGPKKKRKVLKQYGDKGYRPSTGRGVGM